MISIFRSYSPAVLFFLVLYTLLFRVSLWLNVIPGVYPDHGNYLGMLFFTLIGMVAEGRSWVYHLVAVSLTLIQAVYFNVLINRYHILSRPGYLPAMAYVLIASLFEEFIVLSPALMANTFLLWAVGKSFSLYKNEKALTPVFDTGLLISIASLFQFQYIIFSIYIILAIIILRPFRVREYLMAFAGLVLPYYFIGVYFFWVQRFPEFRDTFRITGLQFPVEQLELSVRILLVVIPVFLVLFWALVYAQSNIFRMVVQVRSYLMAFLLLFVAGAFSLFFHFHGEMDHFLWMAIPAGLATALFFHEFKRQWLAELLHLFILLSSLYFLNRSFFL